MGERLRDKVAVITGSTSGIGKATAILFAQEGAHVVVNGRRADLGAQVVDEIRTAGGTAAYCHADVSQADDLKALVRFAIETYGQLDIMVNNAWSGKLGNVLEVSEEEWDYLQSVTLRAAFLGSKYALEEMVKNGGGAILNIASVHGVLASRRFAPYDAAKAGIINLTRSIAVDFGHQGIRCNAICPGLIIVESYEPWYNTNPERMRSTERIYPVGRPGYPIDIARAAVFLASEESSFITGHALMVDGGLTIQLQDSLASAVEHAVRDKLSSTQDVETTEPWRKTE